VSTTESEHRAQSRPWHPTVAECSFMSKDELERRWSTAIRGAARAVFPKQTVALRDAAYLGAKLVIAGRITEERARQHLHKAARLGGVPAGQAERAITSAFLMGQAHGFGEQARGCIEGDHPGAFSAVASGAVTYDHANQFFVDPGGLDLGPAVLVHAGHDVFTEPVGVGVPSYRNGVVRIDAVFASSAGPSWTLTRTRRLRSVSVLAHATEFHRGTSGRLVRGTLIAVDLVRTPADDKATITEVVEASKLTPGQRRAQRLLDEYLANSSSPRGDDLFRAADRRGVDALDVLAPIVAPMRTGRGQASTSPTARERSTPAASAEGGEGRGAPSPLTHLRSPGSAVLYRGR
jgi:hypothetical protein